MHLNETSFKGAVTLVRPQGWSRQRRTIVLRRRLTGAVGLSHDDESGAPQLSFVEIGEATVAQKP
jgi:hypothetical protein